MRQTFPGTHLPPVPRVLKALLAVNIGIFVLDYITHGSILSRWLALHTPSILQGFQFWRLGTYMFLHDNSFIFHVLINMLMLWMFGLSVVPAMGERKFLFFYLGAGVFAGLCSMVFDIFTGQPAIYVGASGAIFAVCVASARYFPDSQWLLFFLFPVPARWAVTIFIGINLLLITSNDGIAYITHLGGALFAFGYFRYETHLAALANKWSDRKSAIEHKRKLVKIKNQEFKSEEIDTILEKISKEGISSLTPSERRRLDNASEEKRKNREKIIDLEKYRRSR